MRTDRRPVQGSTQLCASTAAANASELITITNVTGKSSSIAGIICSYSVAGAGRLTVESGVGNRILDVDITAAGAVVIPMPAGGLRGGISSDLICTLFAVAGSVGKLNVQRGRTE